MQNPHSDLRRFTFGAVAAHTGKYTWAAAIFAGQLSLAALLTASPAAAFTALGIDASGSTVTTSGGVSSYAYVFRNTGFSSINRIELPEMRSGEYLSSGGIYLGSADGWTIQEFTTSQTGNNASFKSALVPVAYIDLFGRTLASGATTSVTLQSNISSFVSANFGFESSGFFSHVDPPSPNPGPVPEPGALMLLGSGLIGLAAVRRRA